MADNEAGTRSPDRELSGVVSGISGGFATKVIAQFLRFALVGLLGFVIDTGLTLALERGAGLPASAARPPAIAVAMLVTWWLNRGFSFRVDAPVSSLGPYAAVVAVAALLNYLVFLGFVGRGIGTVASIAMATVVSMFFSFFGYRRFAFGAYARDSGQNRSMRPGR